MSNQQTGLFELCEDSIYGGQPDFHAVVEQEFVDIFRRQMTFVAVFEQVENFEPGQCCLEPHALEILRRCHLSTCIR